jgi:hypothetical protein
MARTGRFLELPGLIGPAGLLERAPNLTVVAEPTGGRSPTNAREIRYHQAPPFSPLAPDRPARVRLHLIHSPPHSFPRRTTWRCLLILASRPSTRKVPSHASNRLLRTKFMPLPRLPGHDWNACLWHHRPRAACCTQSTELCDPERSGWFPTPAAVNRGREGDAIAGCPLLNPAGAPDIIRTRSAVPFAGKRQIMHEALRWPPPNQMRYHPAIVACSRCVACGCHVGAMWAVRLADRLRVVIRGCSRIISSRPECDGSAPRRSCDCST